MFLDILALLITFLASAVTACWFIWGTAISPSMGILGKIFFGIIMTPIATGIVFIITGCISFGLATLINNLLGIEYCPSFTKIDEEKEERNPVDKATIARCQVLLDLVESIKYLDSPIAYDSDISIQAFNVKLNQYGDYDEAVNACEKLESTLLCYKTTLATTTQGYIWLRSMGEI